MAIKGLKDYDEWKLPLALIEIDFTEAIANLAIELIAQFERLRPADAIHLATALHHNCTHFFTNDKGIRVLPAMTFVTLSEFDA